MPLNKTQVYISHCEFPQKGKHNALFATHFIIIKFHSIIKFYTDYNLIITHEL